MRGNQSRVAADWEKSAVLYRSATTEKASSQKSIDRDGYSLPNSANAITQIPRESTIARTGVEVLFEVPSWQPSLVFPA